MDRQSDKFTITYDVFISYNPVNSIWVDQWLVPHLKGAGLRVAIDLETFRPGAPVIEETERCISGSRKTIVVLSPAWVGDQSKIFESLLVQHEDPGARFRQLIPILLQPCAPPKRIQLLQWVDFTDTGRQEQQLKRVINAVQGAAELPELHPERAMPDAVQRAWEMRWLWVVGMIGLVTLTLLGWWIWSQRPPGSMAPEKYGIAVAEFALFDQNQTPAPGELGAQVSRRIAGFIQRQEDELAEVVKSPVEVWGDSETVRPIIDGTEADRAQAINADVLLYGIILQNADRLQAAPRFYLTNNAVGSAAELIGEHALGIPISFRVNDLASEGDLTGTMRTRIRALVHLLMGLSHYAAGTTESYAEAVEIFRLAANDPEWGTSSVQSGQEVLYLFLGNSLLKLGSLTNDSPTRTQYFQESEAAYKTALRYNAEYARVYNGLGSLYFQQAQSNGENDECLKWNWDRLEQSAQAYAKALEMEDQTKPPSGNVDMRAHLGLGRIYYYQGLCLSEDIQPAEWVNAKKHHAAVIDEYDSAPAAHLQFLASLAHIDLADMAFSEADWRSSENSEDDKAPQLLVEASDQYSTALSLLTGSETEEELRLAIYVEGNLLSVLCWQGYVGQARATLASFLETNDVRSDMKQVLDEIIKEDCSDAQ
jgi:hypothetical protein